MLAAATIMLLIAAICFLLAVLEIQPNRAIPLGLFFLTIYFLMRAGV